jgi:hypothetical protein
MRVFEFDDLQLVSTPDIYVVTYNDKIITIDGKTTFSKASNAKNRLKRMLTANYHQGHYWHKGKKNTFADEGGHMRNGGVMAGLDKVFKKLGKELTDEVLANETFKIEKIQ